MMKLSSTTKIFFRVNPNCVLVAGAVKGIGPGVSGVAGRVFVSYRHADTANQAGWLAEFDNFTGTQS